MKERIQCLQRVSKDVIQDCCLENGAIVAANSTKPYYSKDVKNYFYVWPRDALFACIAGEVAGIGGIQEKFFDWLLMRAEGWEETGLFYEKYYPNGLQALKRFQPDQTGSILYALWHYYRDDPAKADRHKDLVLHSAEGLCRFWDQDHFSIITNDLWEERMTFPDMKENFSYSLGACIRGLLSADQLYPDQRYVDVAREMRGVLFRNSEERGYFCRSFGVLNDERIDASALGLIWPFDIVDVKDPLAQETIRLIEKGLVRDFGVHRYEQDEYDGWMYQTLHRNKGAGFWPILNFWMCIVQSKNGNRDKALQYYKKVVNSTYNEFIPEQIFDNDIQQSISPLCWSHSMFILASRELDFI
ncbi:MAG: hypothetical protein SVZ03_08610 [Spirochaetota bacterium]|nr:hypothetical protein [Spirochaetota bacterium]